MMADYFWLLLALVVGLIACMMFGAIAHEGARKDWDTEE